MILARGGIIVPRAQYGWEIAASKAEPGNYVLPNGIRAWLGGLVERVPPGTVIESDRSNLGANSPDCVELLKYNSPSYVKLNFWFGFGSQNFTLLHDATMILPGGNQHVPTALAEVDLLGKGWGGADYTTRPCRFGNIAVLRVVDLIQDTGLGVLDMRLEVTAARACLFKVDSLSVTGFDYGTVDAYFDSGNSSYCRAVYNKDGSSLALPYGALSWGGGVQDVWLRFRYSIAPGVAQNAVFCSMNFEVPYGV